LEREYIYQAGFMEKAQFTREKPAEEEIQYHDGSQPK
jgi:hypothetical protein